MAAILSIEAAAPGDRCHLAHDGRVALVVDAPRDVDHVLAAADEAGVRITHIFQTHLHDGQVAGGPDLSRATGAAYHLNAVDVVDFERVPVRDGDLIDIGDRMWVRVLATPGHTFTHLSYVLEEAGHGVWTVQGVFSGGSLLPGAVGRPDLLGPGHTKTLAYHQHSSARRLAMLPDETRILPTHGFGGCRLVTRKVADVPTIGVAKIANPALTTDADDFVAELLAGLEMRTASHAHAMTPTAGALRPCGFPRPSP